MRRLCLLCILWLAMPTPAQPDLRPRVRDSGILIGSLPPGKANAITDVPGVRVGHATLVRGDDLRTGVTVVLPHGGNLFRDKVPAALAVQNGFGKLVGSTQLTELGTLESPIALTSTLAVFRVADALLGWMLAQEGNAGVRSLNVVVGETNDGGLSDIRARAVGEAEVLAALAQARTGPVAEGCVGAGTGTVCLGYKGGIGTSSRSVQGFVVGVLAQTNFGGSLRVDGVPMDGGLVPAPREAGKEEGSCMFVLATDAPLDARNLERLARRCFAGMARTGAAFSNGSGDYALAFSVGKGNPLANEQMSPLFVAAAEAAEEAILNSLWAAQATTSRFGKAEALPVPEVVARWRQARK